MTESKKAGLSHTIPAFLRRLVRKADRTLAPYCSRNGWGSSLYYLFNAAFRREHQAVLQGKLQYQEEMVDHPVTSSSLLRRNIHRLEKGLIMRPRREVFGLAYVEDVVDCYARVLEETDPKKQIGAEELKWSHDVLKAFFSVTGEHPLLDRMREQFSALPEIPETPGRQGEGTWTPFLGALGTRLGRTPRKT